MSWTVEALDQFAKWGGLTPDEAARAGLFEVDNAREIYPDFDAQPAIIIPYYRLDGSLATFERAGAEIPFCRLRYLNRHDRRSAWGGKVKKAIRYAQPGRSGTRAYFPKGHDWAYIAGDVNQNVIITEGEAKAIRASLDGFPVIALGGVFNFTHGYDGLLPELLEFKWRGRDVYIVFDSDAQRNPNVIAAEARLVSELMHKHGARCYIVRLPQDGEEKEALDTFLDKFGAEALQKLLQDAPGLGALDAKVVALNKTCAWIAREGKIYDTATRMFIEKGDFVKGSDYSSEKHITVGGANRKPQVISVADTWLTHPHAQRYSEILFRPGEGQIIQGDLGGRALNMWEGWDSEPGDVTPFLMLNDFLFQHLPLALRDLPLKMMAYKVQNPADKIGIAPVLIGPQGCGKSMWFDTIGAAMKPYSTAIASSEFGGGYHGWMENTLFCQIQEVEPQHIQKYGERLKSLITDRQQMMNEKYRPQRLIQSYTLYGLGSNKRAVGSYSQDDRRMFVVNCPEVGGLPAAIYETLGQNSGGEGGKWYNAGGPKWLLHHLRNMDLKGWKPPQRAPMTAEKMLAHAEGLTLAAGIAEDMKLGDENLILQWLNAAMAWADAALGSNDPRRVAQARAIAESVPHMPIRPFYTAEELVKLLPQVVETLQGNKMDRTQPPGALSRELREAGVPYLVNVDDPAGFYWQGKKRIFLVVHSFDDWREPITQADFDRLMRNAPTFAQTRRQR